MISDLHNPKLKKDDRILILEPMDGNPLSVTGMPDTRLFTGGNNLHLVRQYNNMWKAVYDNGSLPAALKQTWTSFKEAYSFMENYYKKRNIRIAGVHD